MEKEMVMIQKYKAYGEWSAPKMVSKEVAKHKLSVIVVYYDEFDEKCYACPYRVVK